MGPPLLVADCTWAMAGFFDSLFGRKRGAAAAEAAEARGQLELAAELYADAHLPEEVARIFLLRGDAETEPRTRLRHFTQAAHLAPPDTEIAKQAIRKRAKLLLVLAGDAAVSAVARAEIVEAAQALESIGEVAEAAEAFARAGDREGEARALTAAGDVERLEFLLASQQHEDRRRRGREERIKDIELLVASGQRREALATIEELIATSARSAGGAAESWLSDRAVELRARRVKGPVVALEVAGAPCALALGTEIVLGRTEGTIQVASSAVSREHVRIFREGDAVVIRDLGSRNGTQLRGVNLAGTLPVGEGLELKLGREVPLRVVPSTSLRGAVEITVGGKTYTAFVGPAFFPAIGLELAAGLDGWVELVARGSSAFAGDVELAPRATLLHGDRITNVRGGDVCLRITAI